MIKVQLPITDMSTLRILKLRMIRSYLEQNVAPFDRTSQYVRGNDVWYGQIGETTIRCGATIGWFIEHVQNELYVEVLPQEHETYLALKYGGTTE